MIYDLEVQADSDTIICCCCIVCDSNYEEIKRCVFKSLEPFCKLLLELLYSKDVVLVAHNGMNYDHKLVIHYLTDEMNVSLKATHESLLLCTVSLNGHHLYFRDTYSYMNMSLKECGKQIGLQKLDCNIVAATHFTETVAAYCMRDAEICLRILTYFNEYQLTFLDFEHKVLSYKGQADVAYRAVLRNVDEVFTRTFTDVIHKEVSTCYYGGRAYGCCYGMQIKQDMCCIDIRSMYPAAMCRPMPCGEIYHVTKRDQCKLGIYFIEAQKCDVPCWKKTHAIVPFRLSNTLGFASNGVIKGWYCSPDIEAIELDGWTVRIIGGFEWYSQTTALRDVYVRLYTERQKHAKGSPLNYVLKILMNSSYGKFAQIMGSNNDRPKFIAWFCLAYSRLQLVSLFKLCDEHVVWNGDTDSVYVSKKVLPLPDDVLMNELSVNGADIRVEVESFHSELVLIARKVYGLINTGAKESHKIKCKGVPPRHKDSLEYRYNVLLRCANEPVSMIYLSSTSSPLTLKNNELTCYGENLKEAKRTIKVVVPPYMYKCMLCLLYHSKESL